MISNLLYLSAAVLVFTVAVQTSTLNGECKLDDDCTVIDSYCNNGTCVCKQHFAYHGEYCVEVLDPRLSCRANVDCEPVLGIRSICKDASCVCLPYHHLHNNICIKNRGLHERCDEDFQCYWGLDMVDKISCVVGECDCKAGYRRHNRRCVHYGSNSNILTSTTGVIVTLLFLNKLF